MAEVLDMTPEGREAAKIPWGPLLIIVIGAFMSILDSSIVNVALPRMMTVFGASTDEIQWVLTGYMLTSGVVIPLTGFLCTRFGSKRLYIFSLAVFTAGSLLCGLAWSTNSIIAARVIQAIGGGMLIPVSMSILYFIVPREKTGIALGVWGIAAVMGPAIGPTLGGYLVDNFSWEWIFTVNIPVGIIAIFLSASYLEETITQEDLKPDLVGTVLIVLSCFSLLLALSEGQDAGWASQYIVTLFLVSGFTMVLFIFWETSIPNPLIDMRVFTNPVMAASLIIMAFITISMFSVIFLIPIYAQNLLGYSPMETGLLMLPMALVTGLLMPISGKIFDRVGAFSLGFIGLLIIAGLTYYLHVLSLDTDYRTLQIILAVRAVGFGLALMPITNAGMMTLPESLIGSASAANNLIRQIAGSMGVAYVTYFVSERQAYHLAVLSEKVSLSSPTVWTYLNQMQGYLTAHGLAGDSSLPGAMTVISTMASRQSYMNGIDDAFVVLSIIGMLGVPFIFKFTKESVGRQRKTIAEAHSASDQLLIGGEF